MSNRKIVAVVVGLVLLLVIGGLVAVMWSPADDPSTDGDDLAVLPDDADEEVRRKPPPKVPQRRWQVEGYGSVVGIVKEYGTDRPLPGVAVSLEAGLPGPDTVLRTTTNSDGGFVIDEAVNFDEWLLRVTPEAPLAEQQLNAVEVVADKPTNVGVVYVTPSYEVPGIVVDEQGDPIHGALVRVLRSRTGGAAMDVMRLVRELPSPPPAVESATTDTAGRFVLAKVPPGSYDIEVSAEQYTQRTRRGVPISPERAESPLRFVLARGFELAGRVVRPSGGSVDGLTVIAQRQPRGDMEEIFNADRRYAVTDEEGSFLLTGLTPGVLIVAVTPEGEPFTIEDDVTIPGTDFLEIVIQGDAWVTGTVTNDGGDPIAEAEVFLAVFDGSQPIVATTETDVDGRYRIDGLRAGPIQMFFVQAEGYGRHPDDLSGLLQGRGSGMTLTSGENLHDVVLGAGAIVRGTVLDRDSGEPIEGATIRLLSVMSMFGGGREGVTGSDGTFEITSVPEGQAMLSVSKDGFFQPGVNQMSIGMMFGGAMRGGGASKDTGRGAMVSITEPGEIIEREIKMASGSVIRGIVQSPDGDPVAGARITLEQEQGRGLMRFLSGMMAAMDPRLSQDGGRFSIPGPPPGSQASIVATAPGWLEGRTEPLAMGPGEVREDVIVTLRRGAVVEGIVTGKGGKPLTGALVRWLQLDDDRNEWRIRWELQRATPSVTDEEGRFRLENVEPGTIIVQADHTAHMALTKTEVEVEEEKALALDFGLETGGVITGHVRGADGGPHVGARIDLTYRGSGEPYKYVQQPDDVVVGEDGKFTVEGLAPGPYDVFARAEGAAPSETVKVETGAPAVTLRLAQAFRVAGYVRFDDGAPAPRVQVQLVRKSETGEDQVDSERTGEDGAFAFEDQPGGTYTIRTGGWGWGDTTHVVPASVDDVQAGTENVLLTVSRGLKIAGTVTGGEGGSQQMGWVSVNRIQEEGDPPESRISTGVQLIEGAFEVSGLTPGRYNLTVNLGERSRMAQVEAGRADVVIEFGGGATIRGRLTMPDGSSAAGIRVFANAAGGSQSAMTDEDGAYVIPDVPPGGVVLHASNIIEGTAYGARVPEMTVGAGDDVAGVDLRLEEQELVRPPR